MNLPRESKIVEYMQQGKRYTPSKLALVLDINLPKLQKILHKMKDQGTIDGYRPRKGEREYFLPVPEVIPIDPPRRYIAPWKPISIDTVRDQYNNFQIGCESIRRNV